MASYIIDGVLILIFLFAVAYYTHRGFVASIIGFLRFFIATGVATLFSPALGERFQPFISEKLGTGHAEDFFSVMLQEFVSSGYIAKALAFSLLFTAVILAIKIIELLAGLFTKLPVVNFVNRTLGMLVGIAVGFFWIELLTFAGVAIGEYTHGSITFVPEGTFRATVICRWLYEHNIFKWIIERLMAYIAH